MPFNRKQKAADIVYSYHESYPSVSNFAPIYTHDEESNYTTLPTRDSSLALLLLQQTEILTLCLLRLTTAIKDAANKYWPHNLVLVTHWLGVRKALLEGLPDMEVTDARCCGYVELKRSDKRNRWTFVACEGVEYKKRQATSH